MKTALIINPKSAAGYTMKLWREVKSQLQSRIPAFEVFMTEFPKHATEISRHLSEKGYERIVVMGGDGSLHEVINGLFDESGKMIQPQIKVGILNSGRGCDFIKSLDIPGDYAQNISLLVDSKFKKIDICKIQLKSQDKQSTHYYLNSFSYGLGGEVAKKVTRHDSFLPPSLMYFSASLSGLIGSKPFHLKIQVPNKMIENEFVNIFAMNGKYSGGGMNWAPKSQLTDGLVDVILIHKMSKLKLALSSSKVYDGTFDQMPEVQTLQVPWVEFKADQDLFLEMDGEVSACREIRIDVLPQVLSFIC